VFSLANEVVDAHTVHLLRNVRVDDLTQSVTIDTPENILLDAEIAGFGSRCVAAMIDYLYIFALLFCFSALFINAFSRNSNPPSSDEATSALALLIVVQFAILTFYHLFFELIWNGQTPGKRRVGIRVVQANGLPVTASGVVIRNLVRLFDFLPLFYGLGLVVLFSTRTTQRLGDLAARTIVIRERKALTLSSVREDLSVRYEHLRATEPIPHYVVIEPLSQHDRRTVIDFLQRRPSLNNREHLATLLAKQMLHKMNLGDLRGQVYVGSVTASGRQAELFLEQIARAFELFGEQT
jgi:uncharacterized RDD family membrane protein YckC